MHDGDVETYFSEGEWRNRIVGGADLPATYSSRSEAFRAGAAEAAARRVHHHVQYAGPPAVESGT